MAYERAPIDDKKVKTLQNNLLAIENAYNLKRYKNDNFYIKYIDKKNINKEILLEKINSQINKISKIIKKFEKNYFFSILQKYQFNSDNNLVQMDKERLSIIYENISIAILTTHNDVKRSKPVKELIFSDYLNLFECVYKTIYVYY